jgi:hypothetical protein
MDRVLHSSHRTDDLGAIGPIQLLQSVWTPSDVSRKTPYVLTIYRLGRAYSIEIPVTGRHVFHVLIDDVIPDVTIITPFDGMVSNSSTISFAVEVSDEHSGVAGISMQIGGAEIYKQVLPPNQVEFEVEVPDGIIQFQLLAIDEWDNRREVELEILVDTEPPIIRVNKPENGTRTNNETIEVWATIEDGDLILVNGIEVPQDSEGVVRVDVALASEGDNRIMVYAQDGINNSAIASVLVILDTIPPSLEMSTVPTLTNNSTLSLRGSTDGAGVRITESGRGHEGSGIFTFDIVLVEGYNEFIVEAYDDVGNIATITVSCTLDTMIEFEFISPVNGATVNESTVILIASGESGLMLRVDSDKSTDWMERNTPTGFNITLEVPSYGANIFAFEVRDPAGNEQILTYGLNRERPPYSVDEERIGPWGILVIALVILSICLAFIWYKQRVWRDNG